MTTNAPLPYRLGLPAWAFPGWKDRYWSAQPTPLASYADIFNTVEGNTTFYRIPDARAVEGWCRAVRNRGFKFCFKLPRTVTHEHQPSFDDLRAFLSAIEPLGESLGPLIVQFPAKVGPDALPVVESLMKRLPSSLSAVIEVRHPRFFSEPALLESLLASCGAGRVVLDTRALYGGDLGHPDVLAALHEKPDLPVLPKVYNGVAFLRLVLHPDKRYNLGVTEEWTARMAEYLAADVRAYVMIHCPNNLYCPPFARQFHDKLAARMTKKQLPALPDWPVPRQNELF